MNVEKKQLIKDKSVLKNIKENIDNIVGITILDAYNSSSICENYLENLDKIFKIEFPIFTTQKRGNKNYEYVEYLYRYLDLPTDNYIWLIPYFYDSNWWLELKIDKVKNFTDYYYSDNSSINLTVFDKKNKLLFDIEYGESEFEYRIIWL